ncbi:hypothetical protein TNCV_1034351 [Trichonephila clavipes]|nr:hypothetical protein TNCV_1034351 [Trichonephila clavipes]
MSDNNVVGKILQFKVTGIRKRGRLSLRWADSVELDFGIINEKTWRTKGSFRCILIYECRGAVYLTSFASLGKAENVSKTTNALDVHRLSAPMKTLERFLWRNVRTGVKQRRAKTRTPILPLPPYSHDLTPCDFTLFPEPARHLHGRRFQSAEEVKNESLAELNEMAKNGFQKCFVAQGSYLKRNSVSAI